MTTSADKSVLNRIVTHKRAEIVARQQTRSLQDLMSAVQACEPRQLEKAFLESDKAIKLMLEIKPASPSAGVLAADLNLDALLSAYNQFGVAISVLTDQHFFGGNFSLLSSVVQQTTHPVLCKDFILDPYQLYEARLAGASAILLIVKALEDSELTHLMTVSLSLGLTPLIEIQTLDELERALTIHPTILLINNRNLHTLEMDMDTTKRLSAHIPPHILRIAASGIEGKADIDRLKPFCDGFLIGSALMRQPPEQLVAKLQELTTE